MTSSLDQHSSDAILLRSSQFVMSNPVDAYLDDKDLDKLLDNIDDNYLASYREERLEKLKKEFQFIDDNTKGLVTVTEEDLMNVVLNNPTVVISFTNHFEKCKVVNNLLDSLSSRHLNVKWLTIDVMAAPFLVAKLKIKVLPYVITYKNKNIVDKFAGFEFSTSLSPSVYDLERYFLNIGVLTRYAEKLEKSAVPDDLDDELDI